MRAAENIIGTGGVPCGDGGTWIGTTGGDQSSSGLQVMSGDAD